MKKFEQSSTKIYKQQLVLTHLILMLMVALVALAYIAGMAHQKALMETAPSYIPYYCLILVVVFTIGSVIFIGQALFDTADLLRVYQDFILKQDDLMDKMIVQQKELIHELVKYRDEEKEDDEDE